MRCSEALTFIDGAMKKMIIQEENLLRNIQKSIEKSKVSYRTFLLIYTDFSILWILSISYLFFIYSLSILYLFFIYSLSILYLFFIYLSILYLFFNYSLSILYLFFIYSLSILYLFFIYSLSILYLFFIYSLSILYLFFIYSLSILYLFFIYSLSILYLFFISRFFKLIVYMYSGLTTKLINSLRKSLIIKLILNPNLNLNASIISSMVDLYLSVPGNVSKTHCPVWTHLRRYNIIYIDYENSHLIDFGVLIPTLYPSSEPLTYSTVLHPHPPPSFLPRNRQEKNVLRNPYTYLQALVVITNIIIECYVKLY